MASWLRKIARFSSFMKVLTFIGLIALVFAYLAPFIHPETIKLIPLFGLMYPIILLGNGILLIYWAIMRSRWFFIVLVFILFGGTLHFRMIATTFQEEKAPKDTPTWKIMTYNVRLFDVYEENEEKRNATRDAILDYVNEYQPDVICFQEFFHQDKPSKFPTRDTLIKLLNIKDYHERYSHKIRNRQNFGICMMSKYPMIAKGNVSFTNLGKTDNYCVFADIVKGKDTLRVYNVHFQSIKLQQEDYALFGEKNKQSGNEKSTLRLLLEKLTIAYPARAEQAIKVMKDVEKSPYPVIVCGDFNDTPMSYVYNQFNRKLVDSFRETSHGLGVTYAGRVPAGRIDYIFHSTNLKAQQFKIQKKAFSDHLAISCEIWKSKP